MSRDFQTLLANHCAPLLCGIKPSNLLLGRTVPSVCAWDRLHQNGVRMVKLFRPDGTELVFLYRPAMLSETLSDPLVKERLARLGYPTESSWRKQLAHLRKRMATDEEFPHEVGFFLGYPPKDVIGFMDCERQCSRCRKVGSLWRVFEDPDQAEQLTRDYEHCKQLLLDHLRRHGELWTVELTVTAASYPRRMYA